VAEQLFAFEQPAYGHSDYGQLPRCARHMLDAFSAVTGALEDKLDEARRSP
jgi:hypothetical protein